MPWILTVIRLGFPRVALLGGMGGQFDPPLHISMRTNLIKLTSPLQPFWCYITLCILQILSNKHLTVQAKHSNHT